VTAEPRTGHCARLREPRPLLDCALCPPPQFVTVLSPLQPPAEELLDRRLTALPVPDGVFVDLLKRGLLERDGDCVRQALVTNPPRPY
jgi:hypothetical protein